MTEVKILRYRPPARLIRCLLCGKEENLNSFEVTSLLANGDELNLNLPNFSRPLYFFLSSRFLALP